MKFGFSAIAIASVVCLSGITGAWAESIERSQSERVKTVKPRGIQVFTGTKPTGANEITARQSTSSVGGRTMNIAQPSVSGDAAKPDQVKRQSQRATVQSGSQKPQAAKKPVKRKKSATRKRKKKISRLSEPKWWRKIGNPKVFAFRDCISAYARNQALKTPKLNLRSVVSRSIKRECDKSFTSMSRVLAKRFGGKKSRKIGKELTKSTFVPAVREAVLTVRKEQKLAAAAKSTQPPAPSSVAQASKQAFAAPPEPVQAKPAPAPTPISMEAELELAKEEMFSCYRDAADLIAPQSNQSVEATVDDILLECSGNTRAFFKRLFAIYPHSPTAQAERMRTAISNNYRPAIAKRVTAIRSAGTSVQKQKITSSAQ